MGFLDNVKKTAQKTKLQGELALIDRELGNIKTKLGLDLFPIVYEWEHVGEYGKELPVPKLAPVYLAAKEDVLELVKTKQTLEEEIDQLYLKQQDGEGVAQVGGGAGDKAKKAGQWMSQKGTAAKLKAKMVQNDREIRRRKEIFGIQVFDELDLSTQALTEELNDDVVEEKETNNESDGKDEMDPFENVPDKPPAIGDEDILNLFHRTKVALKKVLLRKQEKEQSLSELGKEE